MKTSPQDQLYMYNIRKYKGKHKDENPGCYSPLCETNRIIIRHRLATWEKKRGGNHVTSINAYINNCVCDKAIASVHSHHLKVSLAFLPIIKHNFLSQQTPVINSLAHIRVKYWSRTQSHEWQIETETKSTFTI